MKYIAFLVILTQPVTVFILGWMLTWPTLSHIINTRLSKKVVKCEAEIVEVLKVENRRTGTAYTPVILFNNDGNEYKIYDWENGSGNPNKYKVGQRVEIGFNSERNQFIIYNGHKDIFITVFLSIPGLILMIFCIVALIVYFFKNI